MSDEGERVNSLSIPSLHGVIHTLGEAGFFFECVCVISLFVSAR